MRKIINNQYVSIAILVSAALALKLMQYFPHFIETYYLPYIQQPLAKLIRLLLGWIPFSLGDLAYMSGIVWLCFYIVKSIQKKTLWRWRTVRWIAVLKRTLWIYILFSMCWGVLYNRKGIPYQLRLAHHTLTKAEIVKLMLDYTDSINSISPSILADDSFALPKLTSALYSAYNNAAKQYPFLKQSTPSIKKSLFSGIFNYFGLQGYYNPFSGEAQYNQLQPSFAIPNVALHEMAHQLGYAKEDEANFVGFLAAMHSNNAYIKYSYFMDVWMYGAMEIANDTSTMQQIKNKLHPTPLKHLLQWQQYRKKYQSWMNTITGWVYNKFLTLNDTNKGIYSYNEVLRLLVAFEKRNQPK